ncbi:MAG: branched-chain amino acid ABC transporter ATP-binding protein/permease [Proteobacteria bacterium]|jgi:branched-chain amino acid transport system permease protein|nr:branched-chain amino acid ABC transporter ATP-binding protein/permease [Pseudomonadota bacterium]
MRAVLAAVAVAALASLPFFADTYLVTFVFGVLVAYLLAQSWDWPAGVMGYINLGHYVFFGIGAYAFAIVLAGHWPMPAALAFGIAFTVVAALVLALPLFRLSGDYFAFATLALLPLAEVLAFNLTGVTNGGDGVTLPVAHVLKPAYFIALAGCVAALAVTLAIDRARFGYALKAIRNDETAAETMGVAIAPAKRRVLVLSAAFAALAGAMQAWQLSYIDPPTVFGLNVALVPVAMALLGGSGLRYGPLAGVVVLACVQQWLLVSIQGYQAAIYGLLILLIGRFMPGGFMRGLRRAKPRRARVGDVRSQPATGPGAGRPFDTAAAGVPAESAALPLPRRTVDRARPLIVLDRLSMRFGGNVAVSDVSLTINEGEIVGLIGPNGSGKTTLFNCISRVLTPTSGRVLLDGRDLAGAGRDEVARLGVGRTWQVPRPFGDLSVRENIAVAMMFGAERVDFEEATQRAEAYIDYADLCAHGGERADALTLQQRKALEFARALAVGPRLLLVDEVAAGLTPAEVVRFVARIREVRDRYGITVIWVEHVFSALEQAVDRVVALEQGTVIADGPLASVVANERVLTTYLGRGTARRAAVP